MSLQNLFYATSSVTVIVVGVFFLAVAIIAIIIALRLAKFSKKLSLFSEKLDRFFENFQNKVKYSTIITLVVKALKEVVGFLKDQREKKDNDK